MKRRSRPSRRSASSAARAGGQDDSLRADLEVHLSTGLLEYAGDGLSLRDPHVRPDGTLTVALESSETLLPTTQHDVEVEPSDLAVNTDGTICLTVSATVATAENRSASSGDGEDHARDGLTSNSATDRPDSAGVTGQSAEGDDVIAAAHDPALPPFKNPDLLSEVYDTCDTFAEMAEVLEMDVTAETVRRYMIDFDIHQPKTYATTDDETAEAGATDDGTVDVGTVDDGSANAEVVDDPETESERDPSADDRGAGSVSGDDDARADARGDRADPAVDEPTPARTDSAPETPVVLSDGIGLPEDVTVETLVDTVRRSNTIYEVKRDVGVDRQDALRMLQELNLLDLVVGRLATEAERDISREEIIDRLREASATQ